MQTEGKIEKVPLNELKASAKIQTRQALNKEALEDYKLHVKTAKDKGADPDFEPLVGYRDMSGEIYLSDGFHRRAALLAFDIKEFDVEVRESEDAKRDAIENGFKANIAHGVRLTNADKIHNLNLALEDKEWAQLGNRELAEVIGTSESFVRTNRPKGKTPTKVKTRAGREIDTTNIGKGGGNVAKIKAAAKKAAKKSGKPPKPEGETPRADVALDKAYAKISKALEDKGERTIDAVKKGIIPMPRPDIIKLSMNSDARIRELGELVFTSRWKLKTAMKFLDKVVDGQSRVADLINRAITGGGFYRDKVEKNTILVVRDDWGTVGENKDGVTTITPKKKK